MGSAMTSDELLFKFCSGKKKNPYLPSNESINMLNQLLPRLKRMGFLFIPTDSQSSNLTEHGPQSNKDMQTKCCGVMLAQCDTKLGPAAHVYACALLCVCVLICSSLHAHTHAPVSECLSSLTAVTASCVIGIWRGWMDGHRRETTFHITKLCFPAKQTFCDWWLPSFGLVLSKPSAYQSNHRQ